MASRTLLICSKPDMMLVISLRPEGILMRLALIFCLTMILGGCLKSRTSASSTQSSSFPVSATLRPSDGSMQMFTASFKDLGGGSKIAEVTLSVMSNNVIPGGRSRWSSNECLVRYDIPENAIWLVPDAGGTWGSHSITAESSSTFSNTQCTVIASASSVQISGDTVTANVGLKFTPKFAGVKQIYTSSKDVSENWSVNRQQPGNFIVSAVGTP
jgi:hypothetical protein